MKKNLPFSLIVLFTVFTGISCYTAYQSQSFQYKTYCINNNEQQDFVVFNIIKSHSGCVNKSLNDIVICLSHPGDQYKQSYKVSDEILIKETRDVNLIIGGHTHKFFNNHIIYKNKKADDIGVNQVGGAGIVLDRLGFEFARFSGKKLAKYHTISVSQKTEG